MVSPQFLHFFRPSCSAMWLSRRANVENVRPHSGQSYSGSLSSRSMRDGLASAVIENVFRVAEIRFQSVHDKALPLTASAIGNSSIDLVEHLGRDAYGYRVRVVAVHRCLVCSGSPALNGGHHDAVFLGKKIKKDSVTANTPTPSGRL